MAGSACEARVRELVLCYRWLVSFGGFTLVENNLNVLKEALTAVTMIATTIYSTVSAIYYLRKMVPGWHRHVFTLVSVLSPVLFTLAGNLALFWNHYLLSAGLFAVGLTVEVIRFLRDATPLTRSAALWFGGYCWSFTMSIMAVALVWAMTSLLDLNDRLTRLVGAQAEVVGHQSEAIARQEEEIGRIIGILEKLQKLQH